MDLLRPNPYRVGIKAVLNLDAWIRDAFRRNLPYDQFVREIVTAPGQHVPSTGRRRSSATAASRKRSRRWSASSSWASGSNAPSATTTRSSRGARSSSTSSPPTSPGSAARGPGLSPPISGGEEIVFTAKSGSVKHPLTGEVLAAEAALRLGPARPTTPTPTRARRWPRWMTAPDNPYFARVIVNRVWADLMGRGIVEPVDDLRATNPPSNGPLLDALADDFRRHGYDLKHLIRTIMASSVYGLSSEPNERNVADTRNFSRHYRQRLRAEVLLDAICRRDRGPRDVRRGAARGRGRRRSGPTASPRSSSTPSAGPTRTRTRPASGRRDTSVVQALHLMNAPGLHKKLTSDDGRVAAAGQGRRAAPRDRRGALPARLQPASRPTRSGRSARASSPSPGATVARRSKTCSGP